MLTSAFKMGRARRLSSQNESPDSKALARILNLEKNRQYSICACTV